jgi:hypothetical protein
MECVNHAGVEATTTCAHCGRPICAACTIIDKGAVLCPTCAAAMQSDQASPARSWMTVTGLGLAIVGFPASLCSGGIGALLFAAPALVLSIMALRDPTPAGGSKAMARVGLALAAVDLIIGLVYLLFFGAVLGRTLLVK